MKPVFATIVILSTSAFVTFAGQKVTEQFIPMGESPGISGEYSVLGTIASLDAESKLVVIDTADGEVTAEVTESTFVYADRTAQGQTNEQVSFAALEVGLEVEVLSEEHENMGSGPAAWIKFRPQN